MEKDKKLLLRLSWHLHTKFDTIHCNSSGLKLLHFQLLLIFVNEVIMLLYADC